MQQFSKQAFDLDIDEFSLLSLFSCEIYLSTSRPLNRLHLKYHSFLENAQSDFDEVIKIIFTRNSNTHMKRHIYDDKKIMKKNRKGLQPDIFVVATAVAYRCIYLDVVNL